MILRVFFSVLQSWNASIFAYVYPSQTSSYRIYLCNAFWNTGATGTDSRKVSSQYNRVHNIYRVCKSDRFLKPLSMFVKGTLVHEMSHFTNTAQTSDYAYGQSACRALAKSSPSKTINNADSHEYISENTPSLTCNP